jgi:heat-inducible transcriptional repressor
MEKRKEMVLMTLIREHIDSGQAVASSALVEKYGLKVSSATVRNDMAVLEEEGYIIQPHTSAGRVPTEKAFRFYIEKLERPRLSRHEQGLLDEALSKGGSEGLKDAAKALAHLSGQAVFWAFHRRDLYYTGISNLFQQPEFAQLDLVHSISRVIDRMDEVVEESFQVFPALPGVLLGEDNPFGRVCASVSAKYRDGEHLGLFGLFGPLRMDYARALSLVEHVYGRLGLDRDK